MSQHEPDVALFVEDTLRSLEPLFQLPRLTSLKLCVNRREPDSFGDRLHILADGIKQIAQWLEHLHLKFTIDNKHLRIILENVLQFFSDGMEGTAQLRILHLDDTDGIFFGRLPAVDQPQKVFSALEEFSWPSQSFSYPFMWDLFRTHSIHLKRISLVHSGEVHWPAYRFLSPAFLFYLESYTPLVELPIPIRRMPRSNTY
ncbi:hypothetical protein BKA70DRAFT_1419187 [Coprinopsis sp. MPI-PUGE-AT-0042]|nr:hypothetical protein BKA70DRAFT_1419187 [Coprinopsis sp. MPI-PUGE-AT-0042]